MKRLVEEIKIDELRIINGGEEGDAAYEIARWIVHYGINEATMGISGLYLFLKNNVIDNM